MNRIKKAVCTAVCAILTFGCVTSSVSAKSFAPAINVTNVGVNTQYLYDKNDPSWLRKIVIKEDMLTVEGIATEATFTPVCSYPYTTNAECFKAEVEENVKNFRLDENTQKAAYLYVLEQIGAVSLISEAPPEGQTKADWLRSQGIVVTAQDEEDYRGTIMISALYALIKNDLYYVYKGEHLDIPEGTPLEDATVLYLVSLSGQESTLSKFIESYFGRKTYGNLDDYVYYTSLMALYSGGYVSASEIPTLSREEVSRRTAIMVINGNGIAVDADTASNEEISLKYLTAMLSSNYDVTLDPDYTERAVKRGTVPYYILQQMALEDKNIAISEENYTYEECFDTVLRKTNRFALEEKFYSDIHKYDVHLKNRHTFVNVNPTPVSLSGVKVYFNSKEVPAGSYSKFYFNDTDDVQVLDVLCVAESGETSTYTINIYQGKGDAPESDITNIVPSIGDITINSYTGPDGHPSINTGSVTININGVDVEVPDVLSPIRDGAGNLAETLAGNIVGVLSVNENGQLVDANGNIISAQKYEALPDGFRYIIDENGYVAIAPVETVTEPATETVDADQKKNVTTIVLPAAFIVLAGLTLALILVMRASNNDAQAQNEKMKKRRAKEHAKRQKKENKLNK